MKATFIALAALPLLLAAHPASAQTARVSQWLDATADGIGAHVASAPAAGTVTLRARVGALKRLESVELAASSGSPAPDRAVLDAARRRRGEIPPAELVGRVVLLRVTPVTALAEVNRDAVGAR